MKVDPNATVSNGASNDIANNNDTIASITATTTTSSPDTTTIDTTTAVQSADNSLASRIGTGSSTEGSPETTTTTVQTPANTDASREETTPVPISELPGTTVSVSTVPNTPPTDANIPDTTVPLVTTETTTIEASTSVAGVTSAALSSTEPLPTEPVTSTETTKITLPATEMMNVGGSMPASQNLQTSSDTPETTVPSPVTESVSVTHVPPEATTMPAMNDTSESIETNTMQQPEETTPRTTESTDAVEDIETNTIQQSDATIPSQMTETTSTAEPTTTEEISNDIIEIRATVTPAFMPTTFRTRLIDYAQDILSRLQDGGISTVRTPAVQTPTVTIVSPELSNVIPDSSSTNTGSTAQPEETTTVREAGLENIGTTVSSDDVELMQTTTNGLEVTTRNTVGLDTAPQNQSNSQETNARDTLDSSTTTGQTLSSIVGNAMSDPESTTTAQDTRAPPTDEEATTMPISTPRIVDSVTENDPRLSNDTLLAELMTIAKTLFTEAMNDTRQSTQTDGTVGNDDKNRSVSSNGTSEATTAPSELSKPLENTIEHMNVTTPIDLSGNKREDNSTRGPVVGSKISLMESNARPANIENPVDVGDVTTMSLSQIKTETPNTVMVTVSMSSELTTNTPDSQLSNPIESSNNNTEQQTITTVSNNEVELSNRSSEFATDLTTNNPITNSVTANTEGMLPDANKPTLDIEAVTELTTSVAMTEINVVQTNAVDTTNQIPEPTTIVPASDLQVTNDQSLVANASDIATTLPTVSDTQLFGTGTPITESIRNLVNSIDTTNRLNDITTNAPQTQTDLVSETPNLIARFQDTTATTTAQGTAGPRIIQPEQTTETTITTITVPTVIASSTAPTNDSTTSPVSSTDATTIPSSSVEPTVATTTTETTTTTLQTTSTEASSRSELTTTVGSTSEMTTTTVDINENLVSTETTTDTLTDTSTTQGTTVAPTETEDLNMISRINDGEETTTMTTTTTSAAPPTSTSTTATVSTTAQTTVLNRISPSAALTPFGSLNTGTYLGRFGGSQMTPIPRLGSSKAPVRDYLIYGIYPNKTIVRKRPEDNVIDGRNVDSPYVIFGIYPDGRLVRKFPNGTIIPDSPRNPVEVVFTLRTTTTTNRPAPRPYYYNQANQAGIYNNQYQAPVYYSNGRPMDELTGGIQSPGPLDFGLIGNAIGVTPGGPNFAGPLGPPASVPSTNKMVSLSHLFIKIVLYTRNEFNQESNRG